MAWRTRLLLLPRPWEFSSMKQAWENLEQWREDALAGPGREGPLAEACSGIWGPTLAGRSVRQASKRPLDQRQALLRGP